MDGTEQVACGSRTQAEGTHWRFSWFLSWDCLKHPIF